MKFFKAALLLAILVGLPGQTLAQTDVLYFTNGDTDDIWAIQGGVVFDQNLDVGGNRRYRVAVRDTVWLGDMDTGTNVELTLDLDPTGNTTPTGLDISEGTDGATDGSFNYTVESFTNTAGVYRFGPDWSGGQLLFTVTGNDIVGITYDPVNGTLWISDQVNIYEYDMGGQLLGQFAHAGSRGSLAYEPTTDTLWHVSNSNVTLRQYSKAGALLNTVSSGVTSNVWGAEFVSSTDDLVQGTVRFNVTKTFDDLNDAEVEVTLTCNSGLPLQQSFMIQGGDPAGVTFVVTEIQPDSTCTVVETDGPAGYTPEYNGGAGCSFTNVTVGMRTCAIRNTPDDASLEVTKEWIIQDDYDSAVVLTADLQVRCSVDFDGASYDGLFYRNYTLNGQVDSVTVTGIGTHRPDDANWCYVIETGDMQTGVETENNCGTQSDPIVFSRGEEAACTITNTVFYEGIPTLNQYGMALMALLMLGIGFVGFRRFV